MVFVWFSAYPAQPALCAWHVNVETTLGEL